MKTAISKIADALRDPAIRKSDYMDIELSTREWREVIAIGKSEAALVAALEMVCALNDADQPCLWGDDLQAALAAARSALAKAKGQS